MIKVQLHDIRFSCIEIEFPNKSMLSIHSFDNLLAFLPSLKCSQIELC